MQHFFWRRLKMFWGTRLPTAETGLSTHTLRYYEKFGLLTGVDRDENGYRQFDEKDRQWIDFLIRLRGTGMSMRDMKQFSDLRNQGDPTVRARRELLQAHRQKVTEQMAELMENLAVIDDKIEYYALLEEGKAEVKKATPRKNR